MVFMEGTLVNVVAVLIGSLIGMFLGRRFPKKIKETVFTGFGLVVIFIGLQMSFTTNNFVILIFSIIIGSIIGEVIGVDKALERFGDGIQSRVNVKDERFAEGMVTAFLIFCVGSMTILGAIEDGINGNPSILYAKSSLDLFTSSALASVFGIGVLFSIIPLFIFQGGITVVAAAASPFFTEPIIAELSAAGGILLMGIGIDMMEIKKIKVANMLPSLAVATVIASLL